VEGVLEGVGEEEEKGDRVPISENKEEVEEDEEVEEVRVGVRSVGVEVGCSGGVEVLDERGGISSRGVDVGVVKRGSGKGR